MFSILKFIFRRLPWWAWMILAVGFSPSCFMMVAQRLEMANMNNRAQHVRPADPVPVVEFDPARDVTRWDEVGLTDIVPVMERVSPVSRDEESHLADRVYGMAADPAGQVLVALVANKRDEAKLRAVIEGLVARDAHVSGFYVDPQEQARLHTALQEELGGLGAGNYDLIVLEPFLYGRQTEIGNERDMNIFVAVAMALIGLFPFVMALLARRRRRLAQGRAQAGAQPPRRRARQPVSAPWGQPSDKAQAQPKRGTPVAPYEPPAPRIGRGFTRKGDGFDDGPIKSGKGWFW